VGVAAAQTVPRIIAGSTIITAANPFDSLDATNGSHWHRLKKQKRKAEKEMLKAQYRLGLRIREWARRKDERRGSGQMVS